MKVPLEDLQIAFGHEGGHVWRSMEIVRPSQSTRSTHHVQKDMSCRKVWNCISSNALELLLYDMFLQFYHYVVGRTSTRKYPHLLMNPCFNRLIPSNPMKTPYFSWWNSMSTISAKSDDGSHDFPWFPMVPRPLDETVLLEWWPFATLEPWQRRAGARPWESCARCMREARLERAGSRALFGSCAKRAGNGTWWDWRSSNICTFLNCRFIFLHSVQLHLLGALNTRHACIVYAARSYPCSHPFIFMSRKLASTSWSYSCYSKELLNKSEHTPQSLFWALSSLGRGNFFPIYFVDSPYLVVFNDLCFVFCSGQPFWVP